MPTQEPRSSLPPDDPLRALLHNEVHARPSARIRLPALVVCVAVLNEGVTRADEWAHLKRLPGQQDLTLDALNDNFLRLRTGGHTLKWERHSEFTRYAVVQALPPQAVLAARADEVEWLSSLVVDAQWLSQIPGRTVAAVKLVMLEQDISVPQTALDLATAWFGGRTVVASLLGHGHSMVVTDLDLRPNGFERMLVMAPPGTSPARTGRISQRLLELEIYRLMALRGLPVAKDLGPLLAEAEAGLAEVTQKLEARSASEADLLDTLIHIAAGVERATAEHAYRFSATQAYNTLVMQRLVELREKPISGTQTLGEFMQRRQSPAIATVAATAQRLAGLSQRIERSSGLLRTRVDIAAEAQNQLLLAKLTRGQELQLSLQTTVEGLSIAAISYYMVSLIHYGAEALHSAGLPVNPNLTVGLAIPLVLVGVWKATQRVHAKLHQKLH
ncbi:DUF3422 family protein [Paucibacter sp. KCTC 42545]|uniref:DUF3422 family protein n=1 Tax=Paucibacter sp. KCTC 42545 TaxID=1768242 RepID=UPI000733A635|nr:DUF3422 domain-containing protein [Paucibacter sp. KCTC 42545]ALT76866.1 hypothetical protein AT984_06330 [Paucibacter sp. KCTC 42545]